MQRNNSAIVIITILAVLATVFGILYLTSNGQNAQQVQDLKESFSCLVLQPQSDLSFVREWLSRNGWRIRDEFALVEDGKYYEGFAAEQC